MNDPAYTAAVIAWGYSERNRKEFAACAAKVDGRYTAALAAECGLSVDSLEAYRNAYKLYRELLTVIEEPDISRIWNTATLSVWIAAARRRKAHDLDTLYDYLKDAAANRTTVESFRALLDSAASNEPEWTRRLERLARLAGKFILDFKDNENMPEAVRVELEAAVSEFEARLQKIASMEVA